MLGNPGGPVLFDMLDRHLSLLSWVGNSTYRHRTVCWCALVTSVLCWRGRDSPWILGTAILVNTVKAPQKAKAELSSSEQVCTSFISSLVAET